MYSCNTLQGKKQAFFTEMFFFESIPKTFCRLKNTFFIVTHVILRILHQNFVEIFVSLDSITG